jgi:predicted MFS family arabinose efflux permease
MSTSSPIEKSSLHGENFRNLYADIAWYGLLAGSAIAFLTIYAARIGASSLQIGLLTAGPAVINLVFSLSAGRWLENRPFIPVTFWTSIVHRLGYLVLVPLPLLLSTQLQVWSLVLLTLVMSLPGTILAISFNSMFADVTPPDQRAQVVGRRNVVFAISVTLTTLLCGQILDRVIFPLNYQVVFAAGVFGALLSSYHLGRLRKANQAPPLRLGKPMGDFARPGSLRFPDAVRLSTGLRFLTRSSGRPLLRLDLLRSSFGPFLAAYFLFYTFQFLPLPLFPLFYVNELNLSDGAISLGTALFHFLVVMGSLRLGHWSARFGHRWIMVTGALLFGSYPLLLALSTSATLFWVASITGGFIWAILNGGMVNRLMERVPEDDRPAHMALHNLALNLGILIGSLAGPLLAEWIGLRDALWVASALRILGGVLLFLWA